MSMTFLGPFLGAVWKKKRHGYFMQDGATAYIANYSINVSNEVSGKTVTGCRLWPVRSPDRKPKTQSVFK
jgi:hypothetical protein